MGDAAYPATPFSIAVLVVGTLAASGRIPAEGTTA